MSENFQEKIKITDPSFNINNQEFAHGFLSVCTLICHLNNKKLNLAKVFICLLQDKYLRKLFMEMTSIETEFDILRKFLEYEPTLHKSKYIKNYITKCRKPLK